MVNNQKVLVGKFSLGMEHPRFLSIERIFGSSFLEGNCAENIPFNLFRKEISAQLLVNRRQINTVVEQAFHSPCVFIFSFVLLCFCLLEQFVQDVR